MSLHPEMDLNFCHWPELKPECTRPLGFMDPDDVGEYLATLAENGLLVMEEGQFIDAAVVDQVNGPTLTASWLEFGKLPCDDAGNRVSACWLFDELRVTAGLHFKDKSIELAMSLGWCFERSISKEFLYVISEDKNKQLQFLRHEDGNAFTSGSNAWLRAGSYQPVDTSFLACFD
jgi:hypothetical protein